MESMLNPENLDDLFPNLSAGEGQRHSLLLSTAVSLKKVHRPKLC